MTICLLTFDMSNTGGVESATIALANELCKYYQVMVTSCIKKDIDKSNLFRRMNEAVAYTCLGIQQERLFRMAIVSRKLLPEFVKNNKIDILILQGHWVGLLGTVAKLENTKVIFFDHGALINQWDDKKAVIMRWIASRRSDHLVTLTERNRQDYIRIFRLNSKKISVLTNWINEDSYKSTEYNAESKNIISAGRFTEEKGFDHLVDAFAPVFKNHPDWHMDIYGDGEQRTVIEDRIHTHHLESGVTLKGMVSDLDHRYEEYAFYVLPSHREGMPLVLLEAKYNRLPIVSFDVVTGPSEIINNEEDGILVEPGNIEHLSLAMNRLIENKALRVRMSQASQKNIRKFSKAAIVDQWVKMIDSIT